MPEHYPTEKHDSGSIMLEEYFWPARSRNLVRVDFNMDIIKHMEIQ